MSVFRSIFTSLLPLVIVSCQIEFKWKLNKTENYRTIGGAIFSILHSLLVHPQTTLIRLQFILNSFPMHPRCGLQCVLEASPMRSQFVPEVSPMRSKCVPNASPMHPQYIYNSSPKGSQYIPTASQMRPQCIPNKFQMRHRCALNASLLHPQYIPNTSPMHPQYIPNASQMRP